MSPNELKRLLKLEPLPEEGGFYRQTYESQERIAQEVLPKRYGGPRAFGTAIYYLLTPDTCSVVHRLCSDEVYHFYMGDPVAMLQLRPDGSSVVPELGSNIAQGQHVQVVVPRATWQAPVKVATSMMDLAPSFLA